MDALEAIHSRRSIRKFKKNPVPGELVKDVLSAAMMAPSAGNERPWHFVVISKSKILRELANNRIYASVLDKAPLAILVCADINLDRRNGFWAQDCAAATQNLLLAAHASGLGAVWIALYPHENRIFGVRDVIELPENIVPFAIIPLGYPGEKKSPENRFDPDRIHFEKW